MEITTGDAELDRLIFEYGHASALDAAASQPGIAHAVRDAYLDKRYENHAALCLAIKAKLCQCKATAVERTDAT